MGIKNWHKEHSDTVVTLSADGNYIYPGEHLIMYIVESP